MSMSTPLSALAGRSVGMNRRYGLGRYKPGVPDPPPARGPAGPADPYAGIIGSLPKPLTGAQIAADARGQISPLLAAVTSAITKQAQAATHAIGGYSQDAAAKLAALDFTQPYATAEQGQAAVDAALRSSLTGAGQTDANELAQRLAVINDPTVAAAANAVSQNGVANGTTQVAQGSASLGNLLANAAAAGDYGQKLPGIQRLAGLQHVAGVQQSANANIGDQSRQLEAQLPAIIQGLSQQSDSRAGAIASARQNQLARADALATAGAKNDATVTAARTKAAGAVTVAKIKANEQAARDAKPSASLSKTVGYVVDSNGQWIPGGNGKPQVLPGYKIDGQGNVVKVAKTGTTTSKPPTANEINGWITAWKNGKPTTVTVKAPNPDANGNPVYRTVRTSTGKLSFEQAYKRLTASGIPDAQAREYLRSAYKRGEQGRSWLTNEEQTVLREASAQAGQGGFGARLPSTAHVYKGVAYLDRGQVAALKSAGKMPPGHWIQGSTKTQDLGPIYVIDETY